jgi:hypothetical protein
MQHRKHFLLAATLLLAVIAAACTSDAGATDDDTSLGSADLVDALRAADVAVELAGVAEQPFFSADGQAIEVAGETVQVFEYADDEARGAESVEIAADGTVIGTATIDWTDQPNLWATGRLIVLYVGTDWDTIDLLSRVLGDPVTNHAVVGPGDPPYAAFAAERALAERLGITVEAIELLSYERVEWPDACLGLPEPGEACAEVLTPGWEVTLQVDDERFVFHTDKNGDRLRTGNL